MSMELAGKGRLISIRSPCWLISIRRVTIGGVSLPEEDEEEGDEGGSEGRTKGVVSGEGGDFWGERKR
ncbi:hypothetical protein ACFX13_013687 [Malus domestica]